MLDAFIDIYRYFLMRNQFQTDSWMAFMKSVSTVPSTSSSSAAFWYRSIQEDVWLTLLLCSRGSLNGNFWYFSAIKSFFLRHSESNLRLLSSRTSCSKCSEQFFLENFTKDFSARQPYSPPPNLNTILRRKCLRWSSSYFQ